jgi:hypothetical protein
MTFIRRQARPPARTNITCKAPEDIGKLLNHELCGGPEKPREAQVRGEVLPAVGITATRQRCRRCRATFWQS